MANHKGRHLDQRVGDPDVQAWLREKSCKLVGQMYDRHNPPAEPKAELNRGDEEFESEITGYELAMIADGERPLRIAFRIEMIRTSREVLLLRGEIRRLPEYRPPTA